MATFTVNTPDGQTFRVNAPDGATEEDAIAYVQREHYSEQKPKEELTPAQNIGQRVGNAYEGAKLAVQAPFIGGGNALGIYPDERVKQFKQEVAENSDKPGGFGGQILGGATASAVPMMIPGMQSAGAQIGLGGLYGLAYPAESGKERAINTLTGAGGALAGNIVGKGINAANKGFMTAAEQKAIADASRNASRDATIKGSLDAGYVFPPATLKPSAKNNALESISGKYATEYEASARNQLTTDRLSRQAAGLSDDAAINPQSLQAARDEIKKPYQEIAKLGLQKQLDELDRVRNESQNAWREYDRQGTRAALNDYHQYKQQASQLESKIEQVLAFKKRPELIDEFRDARRRLAMNHDVENALIEGSGSIDAKVIARSTQKGDKLTGELKTIGDFANNYPRLARPEKQMGSQGVSKLSAGLGSLLAGGGGVAMGTPGIGLGALPFVVPPVARSALLSNMVQKNLVPTYGPKGAVMIPGRIAKTLPGAGTMVGMGLLDD